MLKPKWDKLTRKSILPTLKIVYKAMIELIERKERVASKETRPGKTEDRTITTGGNN